MHTKNTGSYLKVRNGSTTVISMYVSFKQQANNLGPETNDLQLARSSKVNFIFKENIACLLSSRPNVQFHFPNSWILTLQCRTTMMKMVIPPTKYYQLPTHQLCWLITFKLEGSIVVIQLRVVVLVFPPHPHIHPLVSRNVIKWMTKTCGAVEY